VQSGRTRRPPEATTGNDRSFLLRDEQELEGRGFLSAFLLIQTGDREDLKRSGEIENLHLRKNQNTHTLSIHESLQDSICNLCN
jgi:hypothetical protein